MSTSTNLHIYTESQRDVVSPRRRTVTVNVKSFLLIMPATIWPVRRNYKGITISAPLTYGRTLTTQIASLTNY